MVYSKKYTIGSIINETNTIMFQCVIRRREHFRTRKKLLFFELSIHIYLYY